jgi:hypothetical protein
MDTWDSNKDDSEEFEDEEEENGKGKFKLASKAFKFSLLH